MLGPIPHAACSCRAKPHGRRKGHANSARHTASGSPWISRSSVAAGPLTRRWPCSHFPVAGQAHTHRRGHRRLRQMRLLPHVPLSNGVMDNGGALALGMGVGHRLDHIVADAAHLSSFRATKAPAAAGPWESGSLPIG